MFSAGFGRGPNKGTNRVSRGGSWINSARNMRCSYRNRNEPDNRNNRNNNLGFRVALAQADRRIGQPDPEHDRSMGFRRHGEDGYAGWCW